jgi:hypothetical protein
MRNTAAGPTAATTERAISRVVTTPPPAPGFIGEGHTAVPVVQPHDFARTDPFILLMDDRIDLPPGRPAGGAHPHAGFETVTFVLEGKLRDRDEGLLEAGDVVWMTAGSGVIHNEDVEPLGRSRILQLWLTLPSASRWAPPRFEYIARDRAPLRREPGVAARVYSGSSGSARAATHNYVPVTMLDVRMDAAARLGQELPASYNGFAYVLEGSVLVGAEQTLITSGQVGWLDESVGSDSTVLRLAATEQARVVLYAGEKQGVPITMHGPFVGESRADLIRVSQAYTSGRMPRLSELTRSG